MKHLRSLSPFVVAALLAAGCGDSTDSGTNQGLSFRGKSTDSPIAGSGSDEGVAGPVSTGGTAAATGTRAGGAASSGGMSALASANNTGGNAPMVESGHPSTGGTGGTLVLPDAGVDQGIHIVSATYGAECGVTDGNVTNETAALCAGRQTTCDIWVGNDSFVDPVYGCAKGFIVTWTCGTDPTEHTATHEAVVGEDFYVSIACL